MKLPKISLKAIRPNKTKAQKGNARVVDFDGDFWYVRTRQGVRYQVAPSCLLFKNAPHSNYIYSRPDNEYHDTVVKRSVGVKIADYTSAEVGWAKITISLSVLGEIVDDQFIIYRIWHR